VTIADGGREDEDAIHGVVRVPKVYQLPLALASG
jgi:hypothetical protein